MAIFVYPFSKPQDPNITLAINEIALTTGDTVSVDVDIARLLLFGRNDNVDKNKQSTIMLFEGNEFQEDLQAANTIDSVVCETSAFSGTCQVYGHQLSGTDFLPILQNVQFDGRDEVALTTPLARVTQFRNQSNQYLDPDDNAYVFNTTGTTVNNGKPQQNDHIHCIMTDFENVSQKCATTTSFNEYWLITQITLGTTDNGTRVDAVLQTKELNGVWQNLSPTLTINSNGTSHLDQTFLPYLIVGRNTDLRLIAESSKNNVDVYGSINGVIAKVV